MGLRALRRGADADAHRDHLAVGEPAVVPLDRALHREQRRLQDVVAINAADIGDAGKIAATAKAWGCTGGAAEKESEGSGVYELNDSKCADGANYDIKLDKAFKVISITAD